MAICPDDDYASSTRVDSYRFRTTDSRCKLIRICGSTSSNFSKIFCQEPNHSVSCEDQIWWKLREEAVLDIEKEPILSDYYHATILSHKTLDNALANNLAAKLCNSYISKDTLYKLFVNQLAEDHEIRAAIRADLKAWKERDPACISYMHCFLHFKGFLACQSQRLAHRLWLQKRATLALLIQNRVSEAFAVDIHPGAIIGKGVVFDHATGVVVGETAVIGDHATILHNVTLGGTGKARGNRHPKIGQGVMIGAGANLLGNIRIGEGAKIGAGSVVLKEVPSNATAVGNPVKVIPFKLG